MAIYDFKCPACGAISEVICRMDELKEKAKLTICNDCYIQYDKEILMERVWSPVSLINPGGIKGRGIHSKHTVSNPHQEFSTEGDVDRVWTEDVKVKKR